MVYKRFFFGAVGIGLVVTGAFIHSVNANTTKVDMTPALLESNSPHARLAPVGQQGVVHLSTERARNISYKGGYPTTVSRDADARDADANVRSRGIVNWPKQPAPVSLGADGLDLTATKPDSLASLVPHAISPITAQQTLNTMSVSLNKKQMSKADLKKQKAADYYALLNE
jgi:hypothetical protein